MNDPRTLAKLLRAIAAGSDAQKSKHDIIFRAAADELIRLAAAVAVTNGDRS